MSHSFDCVCSGQIGDNEDAGCLNRDDQLDGLDGSRQLFAIQSWGNYEWAGVDRLVQTVKLDVVR